MSSSTPQSSDIRTTRYTIKANVETTRYFISPETDIEHQVNENTQDISAIQAQLLLKENITDHDSDIQTINSNLNLKENITDHNNDIQSINSALNLKESKTDHDSDIHNLQRQIDDKESTFSHNTDITLLRGSISEREPIITHDKDIARLQTQIDSKESTTDHTADITNLQNQINAIVPGTSYEGLYTLSYVAGDNIILTYNNYLGNMIFWFDNDNWCYITAINNNDTSKGIKIKSNTNSLILPGMIQSGNFSFQIRYSLDAPSSSRLTLNSLKTLTTLPDVYYLSLNLRGAPNLRYFNLMEGLLELNIEGTMTSVTPNYPNSSKLINLRIPASVKTCSFKNILFGELIFEGFATRSSETELDLTLNQCWICDKLYLVREVSGLHISNQSSVVAPRILETSFSLLKYMNNDSLGNRASEGLTFTTLILHEPNINSDSQSSMSNTLTFKRIFNYTYHNKNPYGYYTKLVADSWIE